jgi:hypothetical protein
LAYTTISDTNNSTPADPNHNERALCVLESRAMIGLSAVPNPVPVSEKARQTIIRWNTADAGPGKVYVSIN